MNHHEQWNSFENTGNINYYLRYRGIPVNILADEAVSQETFSSFNKQQ